MATEAGRSTVGDYATLVRGKTYKGPLVGQPGPALLGLGSIEPGGGFRSDYKTYGGECPPELMASPGDLYAALKGATKDGEMIGSVARVPESVECGRLTQDTVRLRFRDYNPEDVSYLYWTLRTPHYREYCASHAIGSANVALSREDFLGYPVPPPTPERRTIVALLDAIEARIQVGREMSERLQGIARAIFKSWFVDFGPVRVKAEGRDPGLPKPLADLFPDHFVDTEMGPIPEGWKWGVLGDVALHHRRGIRASELDPEDPYIALEHMPKGSTSLDMWSTADGLQSGKFAFRRGEILFGKLRPYFHKVGVAPVDGVCSTDIVVLGPKDDSWSGFVLSHVSSVEFVNYADAGATGTRMPRTNWREMSRYQVVLPDEPIARAFSEFMTPIVERIIVSVHESRGLTTLRDAFLPKLVSGEIRIDGIGVGDGQAV